MTHRTLIAPLGVLLAAGLLLVPAGRLDAQEKAKLEPCTTSSGDTVRLRTGCEWKRISDSKVQAITKAGGGGATPRRYGAVEIECSGCSPAKHRFCRVVLEGDSVKCDSSECGGASCTRKVIIKE